MQKMLAIVLAVFISMGCTTMEKGNGTQVSFATNDGFVIYGDYYEGSGKAVILLHMLGSSKESWNGFAKNLSQNNYTVLAIDFRGHGQSTMQNNVTRTWKDFAGPDYAAMLKDIRASKEFLKSKNKTDVAIVGASIGGNLALNYAVTDRDVKALVLISPGLDYKGIDTQQTIESYPGPLMLAAAEQDTYSADTAKYLYYVADGKKQLTLFNTTGSGHGTDLFPVTDVEERIIKWLEQFYLA